MYEKQGSEAQDKPSYSTETQKVRPLLMIRAGLWPRGGSLMS